MAEPPSNDEKAKQIGVQAKNNPFLDGTMVSENGKALCIYIPIKEKKLSHQISQETKKIIDGQ